MRNLESKQDYLSHPGRVSLEDGSWSRFVSGFISWAGGRALSGWGTGWLKWDSIQVERWDDDEWWQIM